jgi:hypothetical protein
LDGASSGAIVLQQQAAVFGDPLDQGSAGIGAGSDNLRSGKALGVLLESIDAEQFACNRLVVLREDAQWWYSVHPCLEVLDSPWCACVAQ